MNPIPPIELSPSLITWITAIVSIIAVLTIRDFATSFVKGMKFKLSKDFNQGDQVVLDGKKALIISIGAKQTIFQLSDDDHTYRWRYVPNARIETLKLEKVIFKENGNGATNVKK